MLKKLTATTCALALFLPVAMPCYADDFNAEILAIADNAGNLRYESSSSAASSSATYRDDPSSYIEVQTAGRLLQARATFNQNINGRINELNTQIGSMPTQLPSSRCNDEFHRAEAEAAILQDLKNYRYLTVFEDAKDLFDIFWLTLGLIFSERQGYEIEQARIENHHSLESNNIMDLYIDARVTMYFNQGLRSLEARIEQAHASFMSSIDALLRGRHLPEPALNHATLTTHAPSDAIQKNEEDNQSHSSEDSNLEPRTLFRELPPIPRVIPSTDSASESNTDHQDNDQESSHADEMSEKTEEDPSESTEPLDELLTRLRSTLPWISDGLYEYASNSIRERLTYGDLPALEEIPQVNSTSDSPSNSKAPPSYFDSGETQNAAVGVDNTYNHTRPLNNAEIEFWLSFLDNEENNGPDLTGPDWLYFLSTKATPNRDITDTEATDNQTPPVAAPDSTSADTSNEKYTPEGGSDKDANDTSDEQSKS